MGYILHDNDTLLSSISYLSSFFNRLLISFTKDGHKRNKKFNKKKFKRLQKIRKNSKRKNRR